jgi:hypothetical protein
MAIRQRILMLKVVCVAGAVALHGMSVAAQAQTSADERRQPTSDAGRPGAPLNPPGKIPPLSGDGVEPLGDNYLGDAPNPTGHGFLTAPGYAPVPRANDQRSNEHRPPRPPKGTRLPNSGIVVTLPPPSTGRQGLPPQTWALLTAYQQDLHRQAETAAISAGLGEGFVWDDAGRHGEVRVVGDRIFNNRPCRDFVHVVLIDGQRIDGTTTICR